MLRERQRRDSITFPTLEVFNKGEGFVCMNIVKLSQNNDRNTLESTDLCAKRTEGVNVSMCSLIIQAHK